jgi:hypothetical protein
MESCIRMCKCMRALSGGEGGVLASEWASCLSLLVKEAMSGERK